MRVLIVAATGSALLALGAAKAQAVITEPIPANVGPGPPPIPALPPAGETAPPASAISDPITPEATCGDWYRQSNYGARWPVASTWWEYQCTRSDSYYYTNCTVGACPAFCPECYWETWEWTDYFYWDGSDAVFYGESYSYSLVSEGEYWPPYTSSYWWDAPTSQWYLLSPNESPVNVPPTASFTVACSGLTCSFDGGASSDGDGSIVYYSWDFGDQSSEGPLATAEHTYAAPGTYTVTLTVADGQGGWDTASQVVTVEASPPPVLSPPPPTFTSTPDDRSSDSTPTWTFSGEPGATFTCTLTQPFVGAWDGGGDGTQPEPDPVTVDSRACDSGSYTFDLGAYPDHTYVLSVTQTDAAGNTSDAATDSFVLDRSVPANAAPEAHFTFSCAALSCSFDASGSTDSDGTIAGYSWDFGDGSTGSGKAVEHTYAQAGSYTVALTVSDNGGATATDTAPVTLIGLTVRGYKLKGLQKVDLSWSGSRAGSFDVYRDGVRIATVPAAEYTDNLDRRGSGNYRYRVCEAGGATCSNEATVTF